MIKLIDLTPIANDIRKAVNVRATTVGDIMSYVIATSGRPGAIMELARGGTNV
jgi:hypothetical protein